MSAPGLELPFDPLLNSVALDLSTTNPLVVTEDTARDESWYTGTQWKPLKKRALLEVTEPEDALVELDDSLPESYTEIIIIEVDSNEAPMGTPSPPNFPATTFTYDLPPISTLTTTAFEDATLRGGHRESELEGGSSQHGFGPFRSTVQSNERDSGEPHTRGRASLLDLDHQTVFKTTDSFSPSSTGQYASFEAIRHWLRSAPTIQANPTQPTLSERSLMGKISQPPSTEGHEKSTGETAHAGTPGHQGPHAGHSPRQEKKRDFLLGTSPQDLHTLHAGNDFLGRLPKPTGNGHLQDAPEVPTAGMVKTPHGPRHQFTQNELGGLHGCKHHESKMDTDQTETDTCASCTTSSEENARRMRRDIPKWSRWELPLSPEGQQARCHSPYPHRRGSNKTRRRRKLRRKAKVANARDIIEATAKADSPAKEDLQITAVHTRGGTSRHVRTTGRSAAEVLQQVMQILSKPRPTRLEEAMLNALAQHSRQNHPAGQLLGYELESCQECKDRNHRCTHQVVPLA